MDKSVCYNVNKEQKMLIDKLIYDRDRGKLVRDQVSRAKNERRHVRNGYSVPTATMNAFIVKFRAAENEHQKKMELDDKRIKSNHVLEGIRIERRK